MLWFLRLRRLFSATGREALILWYAFGNPGTPKAIKAASQATGVDVVIIARTDSIDGALPDLAEATTLPIEPSPE